MVVEDIVKFNRENYYNGAVQTEWFYDKAKVDGIAKSYVFHGPRYYGVSTKDVVAGNHKLLDTASFVQIITNKLYDKKVDNNFILTIAGYGTGKSHLAVTLGTLFSNRTETRKAIIGNISSVDRAIAKDIAEKNTKKNLVIALNGMTNFNLDSEVLKCVRLVLKENDIQDDILKSLTKTYDIARYFISENFDNNLERFENAARSQNVEFSGASLKEYLLNSIESDNRAVQIVNSVFLAVTGDTLHWDKGISAGDIILKISTELCGEGKPFNKSLILFDEFGRYIEYVAANPLIAGDASLQQIFEAVQSSNGNAVFIGFIQYELEAYLSHIDKTANIIRYVGRYSASEKYYISTNFETILANLLEKNQSGNFEKIVGRALLKYESFQSKMYSSLRRWSGEKVNKNVWTQNNIYKNIILEGCYPLHPYTVWLLSNSSAWMQQRSTIAFCAEMFESISQKEIQGDWLPYVYPIDIIDSGIYSEMLSSEEKGLVKSQNCMLYNEICVKVGEKLSAEEEKVLKAILISKLAEFKFYDREDAYIAFRYCTNLKEEDVKQAVKVLEDRHGIIAYDDQARTYDLIAEANGFNEFKRVYARYRIGKNADIEDADEEILKSLGIYDPVDTSFAQENHISSTEWKFEKRLIKSTTIDSNYLNTVIRKVDLANNGEEYRGMLLYAYCSDNAEGEIARLSHIAKKLKLDSTPIIILFLDDSGGEIIQALTVKSTIQRFSVADADRFSKHIISQKRKQDKQILAKFNALVTDRKHISQIGLVSYDVRLSILCTKRFSDIYKQSIPFVFDGFENNRAQQARKTFSTICIKMFDNTLMNIQSYQALNTADKNRIQSCIAVGTKNSWQIFNDDCQLILPQNDLLRRIYNDIDAVIPEDSAYSVNRLFGKFLHAPYGMNVYSYALFVIYFIKKHDNKLVCFLGSEKLTSSNLSNLIFRDGKLKFAELQKVSIQRNLNADVDFVAEICNEIMENTDVNRCGQLRKQLEDILRVEENVRINQVLVGQAKMRLDDGDRLCTRLNEKKTKIKQFLDEANAKFVIHKFIGIFDYVDSLKGQIEEGLPYVYGKEYLEYMQTVKNQIKNFLGDTYSITLKALQCSDITKIGAFQNTYKRVIKNLFDKGYPEQALETELRVQEIVAETKAMNKYNQTLAEFEKDCAMNESISVLSYNECNVWKEKFEGWKKFFSEAQIPVTIVEPLIKRVNSIEERLRCRKNNIIQEVKAIESSIEQSQSVDDLIRIKSKINVILEAVLPDDISARLNTITKCIAKVEEETKFLPNNIDDLVKMKSEVRIIDIYSKIVLATIEELLNKLEQRENLWIDKVIAPIENGLAFNAQQCATYIEKLHSMPAYFSKATVNRAKAAEEIVTSSLHACRIQGVLQMFNSLSPDEKAEFLRLIGK